jgi:hypothetical protein
MWVEEKGTSADPADMTIVCGCKQQLSLQTLFQPGLEFSDSFGCASFIFDDGKKSDVTPIRFVCACEKGHLQDIDWKWVVHRNQICHEPK